MPRLKVTITGEQIHDVGYRLFLLEEADVLVIPNFDAKNVKIDGKQAVITRAEGDEVQMKEFTDFCRSDFPAEASVGDVSVEEYEGKIRSIDSFRDSFSVNQLSKIARTGVEMLGKQDQALGKMDQTLGKQTETINEIRLVREELKSTMEHGFGELKTSMDRGFGELKDEHIKTREMSMDIFHSEVQGLRQEINSLRSSVEEIRKKVGIA